MGRRGVDEGPEKGAGMRPITLPGRQSKTSYGSRLIDVAYI